LDASGNLYISDGLNNRVRKVTPSGIISTFAGNGSTVYSGDGISATSTAIYNPAGLAFDAAGNLYVADEFNEGLGLLIRLGLSIQ
jgi:sugar lactone lactonase YvrE